MQVNGLPLVLVNYSITELELLYFCVNISQFKHLLAKVDSDCTADNLAFTYIMKSKTEPVSARIKRLLDVLTAYLFNVYYKK